MQFKSGVPMLGGGESGLPTFYKYDPRDLPKNIRKLFEKGVSPHMLELEGHGSKIFSELHP